MRSANGQVEWMLRESLRRAGRLPGKGADKTDAADKGAAENHVDE